MFGELIIPPGVLMIVGALSLPLMPRNFRSGGFLVISVATLWTVWSIPVGTEMTVPFMQYNLVLLQVDQLSRIFGIIFSLIAAIGGVYAYHMKDPGQQVAALMYAGGALGVTFAGDFLSLIMFWELMAVASTYLVWARRTKAAERAGMRYLLVHLTGGSLLLGGILLHFSHTGSLAIVQLSGSMTYASWMILAGVALNAAVPPIHAWLPDAYPRATITGAVFLSAFTTKSAVYVLARVFPGTELLLVLGVIMTLYGVIYAVLANDIREILAYHIISQVGYMVAGVGLGTEMALNGTVAHAYSHILYKALLFMGAGVVLQTTGRSKLTELGGLGKSQRTTLLLFMVGAFSISGFPLFNGFISKSMVVAGAAEAQQIAAMYLLLLASVGTFLSIGLKIPYFTWFGEEKGIETEKPPVNMHIGMGIAAFFCLLYGVMPSLLYSELPYPTSYEPFSAYHLTETVQILIFTFAAFWLFRGKLTGAPTISLDTDWFYRRPARLLRLLIVESTGRFFDIAESAMQKMAASISRGARNPAILFGWTPTGTNKMDMSDFNPDLYRYGVGFIIIFILLSVIVLAWLSITSLG